MEHLTRLFTIAAAIIMLLTALGIQMGQINKQKAKLAAIKNSHIGDNILLENQSMGEGAEVILDGLETIAYLDCILGEQDSLLNFEGVEMSLKSFIYQQFNIIVEIRAGQVSLTEDRYMEIKSKKYRLSFDEDLSKWKVLNYD